MVIPITLRFRETEEARIQFRVTGAAKTRIADEVIRVTLESPCMRLRRAREKHARPKDNAVTAKLGKKFCERNDPVAMCAKPVPGEATVSHSA
jgi:hypothetical protein